MSKQDPINTEKQIGEVVSRSEQFVEKNMTKIGIAILAVFVVVAGVFAYKRFVSQPKEEKATAQVFMAEDQFLQELDSLALNGSGADQAGLLQIIDKYSGTDAAKVSNAYAGISLYNMGKYEEALKHLGKVSSKETMVAPSVIRLMGDCYVQLKQYDKAVQQFEKAASAANNSAISPSCLIKAARVYEHQKKYDKALAAYTQVKDKYYDSMEAAVVEGDIIRVNQLVGKN